MVGWHHRLDGHEFEQAVGGGDGQGGLACCSPWDPKSDMTEQLNQDLNATQWITAFRQNASFVSQSSICYLITSVFCLSFAPFTLWLSYRAVSLAALLTVSLPWLACLYHTLICSVPSGPSQPVWFTPCTCLPSSVKFLHQRWPPPALSAFYSFLRFLCLWTCHPPGCWSSGR